MAHERPRKVNIYLVASCRKTRFTNSKISCHESYMPKDRTMYILVIVWILVRDVGIKIWISRHQAYHGSLVAKIGK
jgi:hypothetical protein